MRILHVLGLSAAVFMLAACPKAGDRTLAPQATVRDYVDALSTSKYDQAYAIMSDRYRKRNPRKAFVRMLKSNPEELERALSRIRKAPKDVEIRAVIKLGGGDDMVLVAEKGKWRVLGNPVRFYSQQTPRLALRSFVRAIESRRYDVLMRFVPQQWAESMTIAKLKRLWEGEKKGQVTVLLRELKANLKAHITLSGDRATMPYGDDKAVRFVREEGVWKIEDPD
jgi:hypothetical protein